MTLYSVARHAAQAALPEFAYYVTSSENLAMPNPQAGINNTAADYGGPIPMPVMQQRVCDMLRELYPHAKILIVTRSFRTLIFSGYSQDVRQSGTKSLANLYRTAEFAQMSDAAKALERQRLRTFISYDTLLSYYTATFGTENLIVLPYELLRDDRRRFLGVIEERLGLEPFDGNIGRVNESLTPQEFYWYPRLSSVVLRVARKLGPKIYDKVSRRYIALTMENKLRGVVRVLDRLKPGRQVVPDDLPVSPAFCADSANSLKDNPLYAPYRAEYDWLS